MNRTVWLLIAALGCASPWGTAQPIGYVHVARAEPQETFCPAVASGDSTVYDTTQVTQRPVLYEAIEPLKYPSDLRDRGIAGRVLLAVTVNADGRPEVRSIEAISSPDSALTNAAIKWVSKARFVPVCRAGTPVRVRMAFPVDFRLQK